jgi:hypothetical protein
MQINPDDVLRTMHSTPPSQKRNPKKKSKKNTNKKNFWVCQIYNCDFKSQF